MLQHKLCEGRTWNKRHQPLATQNPSCWTIVAWKYQWEPPRLVSIYRKDLATLDLDISIMDTSSRPFNAKFEALQHLAWTDQRAIPYSQSINIASPSNPACKWRQSQVAVVCGNLLWKNLVNIKQERRLQPRAWYDQCLFWHMEVSILWMYRMLWVQQTCTAMKSRTNVFSMLTTYWTLTWPWWICVCHQRSLCAVAGPILNRSDCHSFIRPNLDRNSEFHAPKCASPIVPYHMWLAWKRIIKITDVFSQIAFMLNQELKKAYQNRRRKLSTKLLFSQRVMRKSLCCFRCLDCNATRVVEKV